MPESTVTTPTDLRIDLQRIKEDILALSEIGKDDEDRGIYRMAFTDADMRGKRWLIDRIEQAGLKSNVDGAANISGIFAGKTEKPRVLVGSHIDTVPCAGALDGTLGVVVGLECLRRLVEAGVETERTLELIAFSDEEGRFGGMFGSQSVCGYITPDSLATMTDLDGILLQEEMRRQGYDPLEALDAARDPDSIRSYLELHIEQGPVLDRMHKSVGIVDEITGLFTWSVWLRGEANHAGTTPMDMRNDAFMGLADFAHEVPRILEENGSERSRATIGKAQILPGAANTVPGIVEFSLDVRDTSEEFLDDLSTAFRKALSAIARRRNLKFDFEQKSYLQPVACSGEIVEQLKTQAKALNLEYHQMPSGAAHDAQIMGRMVPVGMIFVPSKNGKSHSPAEWTAWSDIEAGANVMLQTLLHLAQN
ncbi:Zn-dependent hydrolase [Rubinisphaera sp.]|uniref:Zn-dependent hydrolase n=1 Tax=Rubinisphaera sp. TaxID=2024857 RepID=UPI000C11E084|nr:Zn-dependent hydrolase [Rubinisphaera sp.]MBV10751.1 Zn-dependent hydrolase [Rubinisphaera sp.]HCS53565.1 Zn-dependent hydrolase [Planctomycetaceae bacterium]|tara:strand:- start:31 stop:1296 length:1266 start_codon:yes stop_codon:yes gene_type:complete